MSHVISGRAHTRQASQPREMNGGITTHVQASSLSCVYWWVVIPLSDNCTWVVFSIIFLLLTVPLLNLCQYLMWLQWASDEGVQWAVQNGLHLSRSTVVYFKHNDMASLASTLEKLTRGNKHAEKIRRYIVVESIYQVQCFWLFCVDLCCLFYMSLWKFGK
jgi:hypothetical protein